LTFAMSGRAKLRPAERSRVSSIQLRCVRRDASAGALKAGRGACFEPRHSRHVALSLGLDGVVAIGNLNHIGVTPVQHAAGKPLEIIGNESVRKAVRYTW